MVPMMRKNFFLTAPKLHHYLKLCEAKRSKYFLLFVNVVIVRIYIYMSVKAKFVFCIFCNNYTLQKNDYMYIALFRRN